MRRRNTRFSRIGRERAAFLRARLGSELRLARTTAGLTQRRMAAMAGVSQPFVSQVERGTRAPNLPTACALAAAAGSDLSLRLFPTRSISLRDSGQLELVRLIVGRADPAWKPRLEQPVGDGQRAADLVLIGPEQVLHIEVERALVDLQAQVRSAQLKRAELERLFARPTRLVLAMPGTRRTRRILGEVFAELSRAFPARTATIWRAIATGSNLSADGVLLLPTRR